MRNLIILLSLFLSSLSNADTTNNLVSQDFTTGWTGTNLTSKHGSGTIAGVNGNYILSDSVSLNDSGINKESLNEGFTVTGSAEYWFWSGYNASVTQTIKTVDDNGNTLTQTRVVTGTSGSYNTLSDQLIVNSNTQQDYNVSLRYDFADTSGYNTHYSADLKNPSLTVSYTYVAPLDTATQTKLFAMNETIKEDLKDVKIESEIIDNKIEATSSEPQVQTQSYQDSTFETKSDSSSMESDPQELASSAEGSPSELEKSDQVVQETKDDKQEATSGSSTSQDVTDKDDKSLGDTKISSLQQTMDKIDTQVKDIDKNLQIKHLVKMKAMIDNSLLNAYNIPFYKERNIYANQVNIRDDRVIYQKDLAIYIQRDPIVNKQNQISNIRLQKQKLIREIEVLRNG